MIAIDTNLLVHAHRRDATMHAKAAACLKELAGAGSQWGICHHSLVEFYGVVTRRNLWARPSPPEVALDQMQAWRESPSFHLLLDNEISLEWMERLARQAKLQGAVIHDARIAACCLSHGATELWTVDRDFSLFPQLKTRNPLA
jgi:uncharacterized protein